ncbi:dihydroneopterin aldolase [Marinoscillum sp. 108]|jgi:7,8-dihydroneopterin aldolase/epimerase/oxygenase|uniref:7,8-dihydroneopterin aldolase n=1 Tax=Marinoscillum luteum TaxID=861051 RepID=A0ABW7NB30_9BACT|nr:dihydroneopterin aldolase [Marinoscillum sp. 108]VXD19945.1 Dihydroneopterin aldolase [Marinoscillum sp. 108]
MGLVSLEGMEFYARHGYYEEERKIGNKYSVDVQLEVDFAEAASEDKLEGTVNYEKVYEVVAEVMSIDAMLLEHLAGKMIRKLKEAFPKVSKVQVKVSKYNPPIKGLCHRAMVTLEG